MASIYETHTRARQLAELAKKPAELAELFAAMSTAELLTLQFFASHTLLHRHDSQAERLAGALTAEQLAELKRSLTGEMSNLLQDNAFDMTTPAETAERLEHLAKVAKQLAAYDAKQHISNIKAG